MKTQNSTIDMTICSFALHLLENLSRLWALLSELSWKVTWLIVPEPHTKPEVSTSFKFSYLERTDNA